MGHQPSPALPLRRNPAGQRGLALPRAPQARAGGLDPRRVEDHREQPPRQVLLADPPRTEAARNRNRELAEALLRHLARRPAFRGLTMRIAHWWYTFPLRLRSIFRHGRVEDEMDEEL